MHINKGQVLHELTKAEESVTFLHDIVYDGHVDRGFDALHKAEKVAIIGLLNDAVNYRNALSNYLSWFDDEKLNRE